MKTKLQQNPLAALQQKYLKYFGGLLFFFIVVYVLYLMGFLNYFHAWLMRGIVTAFLAFAVFLFVLYTREKAAVAKPAAYRRR